MRITKPLMCCFGDKARKTRALVNLKWPGGVHIIKSSLPWHKLGRFTDFWVPDIRSDPFETFVTRGLLALRHSFDALPEMRHIKYFPYMKTWRLGGESFPEVFAHNPCQQLSGRLQCVNERSLSERLHICSSYARWGQQGTGDHKPTSWLAPTPTQQTHTHYPADWLSAIVKNWHAA